MRIAGTILCLNIVVLAAGCAQRTLTITSEPSGALVYLNGQEVGRTPLKYDFLWYSDYDVALRADGYETLKTNRKLKAPVYMWPPFDLFSEMLGVKDRRHWEFTLQPASTQPVDPQVLISRANELKRELRSSPHTRVPATMPATRPTTRPSGMDLLLR